MMVFLFFFIVISSIIGLAIVLYLCIIKPITRKASYNAKKDGIYEGMSEYELIRICGNPSKTVIIDEDCKLISYTMDEWKGILFGGSKHNEITVTIREGEVTNISFSE